MHAGGPTNPDPGARRALTTGEGGARPATVGDRMNEEHEDLRCGYPTKSGGTCRNKVEKAGRPCRIHMKAALLDRILTRDRSVPEDPSADAGVDQQGGPVEQRITPSEESPGGEGSAGGSGGTTESAT